MIDIGDACLHGYYFHRIAAEFYLNQFFFAIWHTGKILPLIF